VPERSFEPAIVAGMFREKVTAAWDEHKAERTAAAKSPRLTVAQVREGQERLAIHPNVRAGDENRLRVVPVG
jgi:hypothetical protein